MSGKALPPEREFLSRLRKRTGGRNPAVRVGIGDDCAVLRPPAGHQLAVTTDLTIEGVHFRRDWHPARSAGHRCLARGLSDLAAMGARPAAAFLSLALPAGLDPRWVDEFLGGMLALADEHRIELAGGDLAQSPAVVIADIVATGFVPEGKALLRSGARAGDGIYVTGALGGAAAELALMAAAGKAAAGRVGPQLFPEPRVAQGLRLRGVASAAMDLSDGLSVDLLHLCEESGLRAEIAAGEIPVHPLAARRADGLALALHGGEDYELLFTAPPAARVPRRIAGIPVRRIGAMRPLWSPAAARRGKPALVSLDGSPLAPDGWEHFRR